MVLNPAKLSWMFERSSLPCPVAFGERDGVVERVVWNDERESVPVIRIRKDAAIGSGPA